MSAGHQLDLPLGLGVTLKGDQCSVPHSLIQHRDQSFSKQLFWPSSYFKPSKFAFVYVDYWGFSGKKDHCLSKYYDLISK